jgi:hypothetical protein
MANPKDSMDGVNKRYLESAIDTLFSPKDTLSKLATQDDIKSMLTGTGTAGYISQFTAAKTIDTTGIYWNGKMGIGTTNPNDGNLVVNSSTGGSIVVGYNDSDGSIVNKATLQASSTGGLDITPTGDLQLNQNSVQPFTSVASGAVDNTIYLKEGKVGIGINTPTVKLHISDTSTPSLATKGFLMKNENTLDYINIWNFGIDAYAIQVSDNVNYRNLLLQPFGGKIGVNTTAPDATVEVNSATGGSIALTYNDSDGSAVNKATAIVTATGDLTITPSGGDVSIVGNITASKKIAAQDSICLGKFKFIVRLDTLCSVTGTDTLRIHPKR